MLFVAALQPMISQIANTDCQSKFKLTIDDVDAKMSQLIWKVLSRQRHTLVRADYGSNRCGSEGLAAMRWVQVDRTCDLCYLDRCQSDAYPHSMGRNTYFMC